MSAEKAAEKRAWFDASWDPEVPLAPAGDLDPRAQALMEPGETLLWTGRAGSIRGLYTQTAGAFGCWGCALGALTGIPISLIAYFRSLGDDAAVLLAFAFAFALAVAFGEGLLGCVVVLIPSLREAGAIYAVTDRRAFRIRWLPWRRVTSYCKLDPLSVRATAGVEGKGNLLFADERWETPWGAVATPRVGFFGVPAVRQVEKLLLAVAMRPHAGPAPAEKSTSFGQDLRSRSASRRAVATARFLRLDGPALDRALEGADMDVYLLRALGVVGVWRALGEPGAQAILDGMDGRPEQRQASAEAIARFGKEAVISLIRAWPRQDDDGKERLLAALNCIEEGLLAEALGDALLSKDRMPAVWVAENLDAPRILSRQVVAGWIRQGTLAVEPLLDLVRSSGVVARYWAAEAIGYHALGGAAERVRAALSVGSDPGDGPIAAALAFAGDPTGLETLIRRLGDGEPDAQVVVAGALGSLGALAAPALDALRQAARTTEEGVVRTGCRQAIKSIQDALGLAPVELEAASAPAGTGTEPEAALPPGGTGTEPEASMHPRGHARPHR